MVDVFLSYAREDTDRAVIMVRALSESGLSVWFDRLIPTAKKWETVVRDKAETARCVVMLWSDHAATSHWVREEGTIGLERAVLVPVRISQADIPYPFGTLQFADLSSWEGNSSAQAFADLLKCIRIQMMPRCQIGFESIIEPRDQDLQKLYEAYLHIASRFGCVPAPGQFQLPSSSAERQRLYRAVSTLQVTIEWDYTLKTWYADASRHKSFLDRAKRIERHIPLIWLRLLTYSGPFFSSVSGPRTHANFFRFASLMFFHEMFSANQFAGERLDVPLPLNKARLDYPRWEGAVSAVFPQPDEVAITYITHIDDYPLPMEELFYGPKYRAQKAFGRSLKNFPYTEPLWLELYLIPQRELRLALEGSSQHIDYHGNAKIRKIADLDGRDLEPLYD
ncbi:toll/interleukin-1 receptor domain-containing protein [Bradyrhizobium septentrionale]|uniref:toll/interleukin-1 receptor domain-containing protein n=1 Tax=Bradyrhizobium septentrionale TaxID=1404411 RepID=UPI001596A85E|nr:toll/interleukin-1 receptor domain-containing protein [Bradyrhizobium septentrionale]UGY26651.1 toll/interleukin-1 receptor domain-containing protein [Bradyrhizobium septentrionale]